MVVAYTVGTQRPPLTTGESMKLTIRRETLAELNAEELVVVAGGATTGCTFTCPTKPLLECLSVKPACFQTQA